jgi:sugar lactone lactonase YvrE
MAIKTTGASIITSKSAISSGLVIVNRPEGYVITGPRVEAGTTFKKLVVTPGSPDNVEDITGGGGTAPTITSIVVTDASWVPTGLNVIDSDLGGFIEINGTNFDSGAIVYLNGEALTTTFVDSTKLRVVVPPTTAGVYAIMLFNSDDFGTIFTNLTLSIAPTFITPAGSLGSFYETLPVVANVSANADSNVTYAVFSGSLPAGLTLVSGNGNITGNAPPVSSETNYPFVVSATDEEFQASTRSFSMTILPDLVTWIVPSDLDDFIFVNNEPIASITLNASAISGQSVSYTANILPEGLTIVGSAVTGTPLAEGNTNTRLTATSASTNKTGNVDVLFKIRDRWKVDNYGLINSSNCIFHGSLTPATTADDIFIDSSGRHFFTINPSNDRIYQFFLTKPWSIRTATYVANIYVASFESSPAGIDFKPDGTKMFICGFTGDRIHEFALPTAWDITSATNIGNVLLTSLSAFSIGPRQLRFHSDGAKFYVSDVATTRIYQFNLSVPWQANTASNVKLGTSTDYYDIPPTGAIGRLIGMDFSSDFSKFYGSFGTQTNIIAEFDLQTPGQANNMSLVTVYDHSLYPKYYSGSEGRTWYNIDGPIRLKPDGTKMYTGIRGFNFVTELSLPTPYSVATLSIDRDVKGFLYIAGLEIEPTGMYITPDGTKLFFIGSGSTSGSFKHVFEISLSVPYDIASGIAISNTLGSYRVEISTDVTGIEFKPDGTKMFLCETSTDKVFEFKLNTAWASNSAVRIGNITVSDNPEGVIFKPDGTKMFVCNNAADRLTEWALSTPWQVNTAVQIGLLSISAIESNPVEFAFKPDGNVFYVIGSGGDRIYQFNLSTPWQVNTAVYVSSILIGNFESVPESIRISNDGNYIYFLGQNKDYIWQFGLN